MVESIRPTMCPVRSPRPAQRIMAALALRDPSDEAGGTKIRWRAQLHGRLHRPYHRRIDRRDNGFNPLGEEIVLQRKMTIVAILKLQPSNRPPIRPFRPFRRGRDDENLPASSTPRQAIPANPRRIDRRDDRRVALVELYAVWPSAPSETLRRGRDDENLPASSTLRQAIPANRRRINRQYDRRVALLQLYAFGPSPPSETPPTGPERRKFAGALNSAVGVIGK